eukprot:3807185-Amphidinium_carterae.1
MKSAWKQRSNKLGLKKRTANVGAFCLITHSSKTDSQGDMRNEGAARRQRHHQRYRHTCKREGAGSVGVATKVSTRDHCHLCRLLLVVTKCPPLMGH